MMAMSATVLSAAMRAGILSAGCGAVDGDELTALCDAISTAVVNHVTSAGVVTVASGIAVQVAYPAGTGATIAPGTGAIT